MTLMEMILIILFVLFWAAVLLPFPRHRHLNPRIMARVQIQSLSTAIDAYEIEYGRLPIPEMPTNVDVTFGLDPAKIQNLMIAKGTRLIETNSDVIIILMDLNLGVNTDHKLNPKQIQFLSAKLVNDTSSPGVSTIDHQYRDFQGNPYVISLDANHDGFVRDAFYANAPLYLNKGWTTLTNRLGLYEFAGRAMIWSRGRDGKINVFAPADSDVNKDNIISWN